VKTAFTQTNFQKSKLVVFGILIKLLTGAAAVEEASFKPRNPHSTVLNPFWSIGSAH
jgi:hypothetical protein